MNKIHSGILGESLETKNEKEPEQLNLTPIPMHRSNSRKDSSGSYIRTSTSSSFATSLRKKLESRGFTIIMSIVTIYALFGDDIRLSFFSKPNDPVFFSLASVTLGLFFIELVLSFYAKKHYRWSYYFWLDVISTISMIPDIGWAWEAILGIGVGSGNSNTKKFQNAAKASRIGTRTSRVIRIIRLIRLVRIVKLYRQARLLKEEVEGENQSNDEAEESEKETLVGSTLSNITTKKVITLILLMLLLLPLFDTSFYNTSISWDTDLSTLSDFASTSSFENVRGIFISDESSTSYPLIHLSYADRYGSMIYEWNGPTDYGGLRYEEIYYVGVGLYLAIFDISVESQLLGVLDICQTIFVMLILTAGALIFSRDAEKYIIRPVRQMIEKVRAIANDPSILMNRSEKSGKKPSRVKMCCSEEDGNIPEILLIENTIVQIGALLVLVFGEAGGKIIKDSLDQGGELVLGCQGSKVFAVFCFCDIRNFTDITEELQESIILFVNEIAFIIHRYAYIYQGSANKNIGDAFLLVWKVSEDSGNVNPVDVQVNADLSVLCVLKIISNIRKEPQLQKYRNSTRLNQRMTGFDIKLGFGVHLGWAIEGAVGSQFKIDPSYLSPNVNITMSLEGLTKHFGVPLIFTGAVEEYLSQPLTEHCRLIDIVKLPGHQVPFKLYTHDLNPKRVFVGNFKDNTRHVTDIKKKVIKKLVKSANSAYSICEKSGSIKTMVEEFTQEFYSNFAQAVDLYLGGYWKSSRDAFGVVLGLRPEDPPSISLLSYMQRYDFNPPEAWMGYRSLNELK